MMKWLFSILAALLIIPALSDHTCEIITDDSGLSGHSCPGGDCIWEYDPGYPMTITANYCKGKNPKCPFGQDDDCNLLEAWDLRQGMYTCTHPHGSSCGGHTVTTEGHSYNSDTGVACDATTHCTHDFP